MSDRRRRGCAFGGWGRVVRRGGFLSGEAEVRMLGVLGTGRAVWGPRAWDERKARGRRDGGAVRKVEAGPGDEVCRAGCG